MNLFKEEIGRSYLEHSQKGQTWSKHKYVAIKNGRYIYPEDLQKGKNVSADKRIQSRMDYINAHRGKLEERRSMQTTGSSQAIESAKRRAQSNSRMYFKTGPGKSGTEAMDKAMADTARRKQTASPEYRSRQINDQIKSAHSNATSSKMDLTPGSELKKRAEERQAAKTAAADELKSIADKIKSNNTSSAPKKEEKKNESTNTSTETAATTASTSTETKKSGSGKGRKGSSSKKSSSKKDTTKTDTTKTDTNQANTVTPASASEEAKTLGLSEQDLKTLESSIDINSTERESVLKSLALKVIRGDFGNGDERKKKLGKYYAEIQKKVNEFMKEMKLGKTSSEAKHSDYTSDVLCHHGVMGMKWGVRRYQNRDGSLTELGKRRLGVESVGDSPAEKRKAHAGIHANVSTDNRNVGNVLNAGSVGARTGSGMAKKAANREREKKRREMDVSKMSDQDLQKAVNRMNLERNYKNLKTQDIATGKDYVADVLDVVGDVASIGASAAMIASAIYMIKR